MTYDKAKEVISKWIEEIIVASKQLKTAEMLDTNLVGKEYKANLISKSTESIQLNKQKIMKAIDYVHI